MTPQEQQGIRQLGGKIAETGTELGLYGGVGGLMMGAAGTGIRAGSPSWMKGRIVPEARESVWRGMAKSRAKVTKEDWRQIYGGLKEMEMKIPEWVLKEQKWEAGTMAKNIRATHTAPSIKLGKIPGQRGGTIRLNVLGSMDDFKEFIYSGYHEGGGHSVTTMLKNYVNSTPQHPVLKNRINNMFRVHERAQKNEKALRLVSKSLQDQALTQDVARSAILEKAASNLENLAHRIYLSSPDELLSRGMKAALKRGEDFQTVFKRKMLNAIKTSQRQNQIITALTDKANRIINATKQSQSAKVLAKRYNLTPGVG
jgi:hypothetical protein